MCQLGADQEMRNVHVHLRTNVVQASYVVYSRHTFSILLLKHRWFFVLFYLLNVIVS